MRWEKIERGLGERSQGRRREGKRERKETRDRWGKGQTETEREGVHLRSD